MINVILSLTPPPAWVLLTLGHNYIQTFISNSDFRLPALFWPESRVCPSDQFAACPLPLGSVLKPRSRNCWANSSSKALCCRGIGLQIETPSSDNEQKSGDKFCSPNTGDCRARMTPGTWRKSSLTLETAISVPLWPLLWLLSLEWNSSKNDLTHALCIVCNFSRK